MPLSFRPPVVALLLIHALALGACDTMPPPPVRDGGGRDGGTRDAGGMDAQVPDGAVPDGGGTDGTVVRRDAGTPVCTTDIADVIKLATDSRMSDRIVGLGAGGTTFAIVWSQLRAGTPDIYGQTMSSSGTLGTEAALTADPSNEASPTIVPVGTSWLTAFVDNEGATSFELRSMPVGPTLTPTATPVRLTNTALQLEDNPVLLNTATGVLAAWVEDDMVATSRIGRALALTTTGAASGTIQTTTPTANKPGQIALGLLDTGPALVWAEGVGGSSSVLMQPLRPTGELRGALVTLSTEGNADGTVDAAFTTSGGAVVFGALVSGVRREVRFRAVDMNGTPIGSETILTAFPSAGSDASIAQFAGGYAVSYRRVATGGDPAQIRLLLVSALGEVLDEVVVAQAQDSGGRTTVRVSGDGQIGVSWADRHSAGTDIRFALIRCGG